MGRLAAWFDRPPPPGLDDAPTGPGPVLLVRLLLHNLCELVQLNLLFLLFCLPVVTAPAACTAMSRVTLSMVRGRSYRLWREFTGAFRAEWRASTAAGIVLFGGVAASVCALAVYAEALSRGPVFYLLLGLSALFLLLLTMMSGYTFPMLALVELPLGRVLRNALLLSLIRLGPNLAALAAMAALAALCLSFLPYSLPAVLLLLCSGVNFIAVFAAYPGLKRHVMGGPDG